MTVTSSTPIVQMIDAGVRIHGVSPGLSEHVLARVSSAQVCDSLASIRADAPSLQALGARSYLHANGFFKLPLAELSSGARVRLHFWPGDARAEENVHGHRWHMASRVLSGTLHGQAWAADAAGEPMRAWRYAKTGRSLSAQIVEIPAIRVRATRAEVRSAGDVYHMRAGALHRIVQPAGVPAVTLMVQSASVDAENLMLGAAEPDVTPTPLGAARTAAVLTAVMQQLGGVA